MSKEAKLVRGQLRQIAKELLPDLIASELNAKLEAQMRTKLNEIHTMVKDTLTRIDDRQKDVQNLIIRELAKASPVVAEDTSKKAD